MIWSPLSRSFAIAFGMSFLVAQSASALFLDLRGLPSPANSTSAAGVRLTWSAGISGSFQSTATQFGFDHMSPGDAPNLIDGGGGSAERAFFSFPMAVYIDSIVISDFGVGDAGTFNIKGGPTFTLANGVNPIGGEYSWSSSNTLSWTGPNTAGAGLGFSVDGFNVRPVSWYSADFDGDADVDGADFLVWQRGLGSNTSSAPGNANSDSRVDDLDLQVWRLQFGAPIPVTAVPEPRWCLASLALGLLFVRSLRRV